MKTVIIMVSMISAAIIIVVLMLSAANGQSYSNNESTYEPIKNEIPEFSFYIETTTMKFWDRVKSLNTTTAAAEEDDGNSEAVTDEEGNIIIPESDETPVTDIPQEDVIIMPVTPSDKK